MNLTNRGKVYLLICILSLVFSYLIITLNFFPHLGFPMAFLAFLLLAYKYKRQKDKDTKLFFIFSILFSILIFIRSEPFITFLNLSGAFFFGLLVLIPNLKNDMGFSDYICPPIIFLIRTALLKNSDYYLEFKQDSKNPKIFKAGEIVFGILITILLMLIVIPLLSSANPFFQKFIENSLNIFNLSNLLKKIGLEQIFIWLVRLVFFLLFIFLIPKILTLTNKTGNYSVPFSLNNEKLPLSIPKLFLTFILLIFFITQLQYYFAGDSTLSDMGISHSQRAREVFAQLSFVAGIILVLIYNARNKGVFGKALNWILGIQAIFLTLMAYKSDFDYINAWGLTYKRLYGLTFASFIAGIIILFFINYRRQNTIYWFVKKTVIFSAILILLINLLNFDYLIYHLGKSKTGQGVDYTYLSTLSADSLSYRQQFLKLEEVTKGGKYSLEDYNNKNPLFILNKIELLQRKYQKFDFRTLNLMDYFQYREIKGLNTKNLRLYYSNKLYPVIK